MKWREGEWSDAGSCADGELGCRSSGKGGQNEARQENGLRVSVRLRQPGGCRGKLPELITCLQSAEESAESVEKRGDAPRNKNKLKSIHQTEGTLITCQELNTRATFNGGEK